MKLTPMKNTIDIYTDGACEPNPGIGGWGFVVYDAAGAEVWTQVGGERQSTNNRMELKAIIEALRLMAGKPCTIFSDSQLCVNTLTKWAAGWKRKGWVKGDGKPVKNIELVQEAFELYKQSQATIAWVRGHVGVIGNERADRLANEGRIAVINSRVKGAA